MSFTALLYMTSEEQAKTLLARIWRDGLMPGLREGHEFEVRIRPKRRTTAQNARLWAMLHDISRQVEWHGKKLTATDWKHVFSSAITKQAVVPNLDGTGFVVLGQSTSDMSKGEMSEMIELMLAFGAERSVVWAEPDTK